RELAERIPEAERLDARKLPAPVDLADKLAADAAFADLFLYRASDAKKDNGAGWRYAAFVLARGRPVRRVELGEADAIHPALAEGGAPLLAQPVTERGLRRDDPPADRVAHRRVADAGADVRRRVWDKLAAHFPDGVQTVFVCPDGRLGELPFAALPGKHEGRLLVEEVSVRLVPYGPALFDWLQPRKPSNDAARLFVLGGIDYRAPATPDKSAPWKDLPGSDRERRQIADLARGLRQPPKVEELSGAAADSAAVLRELTQARWAHLATHGYFAAVSSE